MKRIRSSRLLTSGLILIVTLSWGLAWVFMKIGLNHMGPITFSAFRFALGTAAMVLFLAAVKRLHFRQMRWKPLFILGLLQTLIVYGLVMLAMRYVPAGKSSVLLYAMPISSSLLASRFLQQRLSLGKVGGLCLGISGLTLILGLDLFSQQSWPVIWGELLILVASFCWGVATIFYQLRFDGEDRAVVNTYQMLVGSIGFIIWALMTEWGDPIYFNAESISAMLFTGVIASALSFTLWYAILEKIDTAAASIALLLVPVFGVLFSWLFLDEPLTLEMILGGCLILCGISITTMAKDQPKNHPAATRRTEHM